MKYSLILIFMLCIFTFVVAYGHHKALGFYLDRLTESMGRVSGGEREHRFAYPAPMEIEKIGSALNKMLDSIDSAEEEIENHRRNQQRLENELLHAEKLASIGKLATGIAHELGAPLSVIKGKAQRGLRQNNLPEQLVTSFEGICREVMRMESIVRQLLDYCRRNPLKIVASDPARIAASAIATVEENALNNNVVIKIDKECDTLKINVDPIRIHQAFVNLLQNAIHSDNVENILMSWHLGEDFLQFNVEDDGFGVAQEDKERIFEPFFTTKHAGEGTGLGLSIVRTIAEEHGGSVTVKRSILGGASFIMTVSSNINK